MNRLVLQRLSLIGLLASALLLAACGGSDTKIVERDPIVIEDDHEDHDDHDHDDDHNHDYEQSLGRLLISEKDTARVRVLDVAEKSTLAEFTTSGVPSAVYASPSHRFGYVVQRTDDRVDVIDGGLWQEDHGDHMHPYAEAPRFMSFHTDYARPTHFTGTDSQTAIFYDGNVDTSTPAAVAVFTETDLADNGSGIWLDYTTHQHGAAQARGDYLLSTIRDPASSSTLPHQVGLYHAHGDHFDEELVFEEECPGLHGSAQNHEFIAFGCTDGVLVIGQDGDTFTASKLPNPEIFTGNTRIGTLVGDEHLDIFVGIASGHFYAVDPEAETITPIVWAESGASATGYGFAEEGELFVILDNQGKVTILSVEDWSVVAVVQAITSNITALPTGSRFELALTPGHHAFVMDPIANQIKVVDLEDAEVIDTIQLNFVPHKLAWLGFSEAAGHDHDH